MFIYSLNKICFLLSVPPGIKVSVLTQILINKMLERIDNVTKKYLITLYLNE